MSRRVVFHEFGGVEKLGLEQAPELAAGPGQVLVRVVYAGLNPSDLRIMAGTFFIVPDLPAGCGNDFSGVVVGVGAGVEELVVGNLVFGGRRLAAAADYLLASARDLHVLPAGLGLDVAGGLQIAGTTAVAGVRAIAPSEDETIFVSGAAGGVGVLAAQFSRACGGRVIGSASPANFDFLRALGVIPVNYDGACGIGCGNWHRLGSVPPSRPVGSMRSKVC